MVAGVGGASARDRPRPPGAGRPARAPPAAACGTGYDAARARTAHVVALPHVHVPQDWAAPELPRGPCCVDRDRRRERRRAGEARDRRSRRRVRAASTTRRTGRRSCTYLAGSFPSQVEVLATAASVRGPPRPAHPRPGAAARRTSRTFRRLQVVGGAGTGKTWLALEQARRRAKAGDRVALLCYSRGLARYLAARHADVAAARSARRSSGSSTTSPIALGRAARVPTTTVHYLESRASRPTSAALAASRPRSRAVRHRRRRRGAGLR